MKNSEKEAYEQILASEGFVQHPNNKTLWTALINNSQYGVKLSGMEPVVFKIGEDMEHVTDPSDPVIRKMVGLFLNPTAPSGEQPRPPSDEEKAPEQPAPEPEAPKQDKPKRAPKKAAEPAPENKEVIPPDEPMPAEGPADEYDAEFMEAEYIPEPPVTARANPATTVEERAVSHRIRQITCQLGECGKIKIGRKGAVKSTERGKSFRAPQKLDHFVVTTTEKDEDDDFVTDERIMATLGENCRSIKVRLPYNDPVLNFPTSYAYFDSAKCVCRGDGKYAQDENGKVIDCDPATCPWSQAGKCKPNGVLSVILDDAPAVGGVYKFRTTSWNSIRNILSSMDFIQRITGGILAGLPLEMTLVPKTTNVPGQKMTTTIYMVNLVYRGTIVQMIEMAKAEAQLRAGAINEIKMIENQARLMLESPIPEEECSDIACEFYPDTVREEIAKR